MNRAAWLGLAVLAAAFWLGWQANGWHRDSVQLAIELAASQAGEQSRQAAQAVASASARQLEGKLDALRNAPPKEIRTEVVKPVFTRVCLSDEFVRLYNDAASRAEHALSGKSAGEVPGNATTP
ncbi:hypothetical protein [Gibbsiella quercinecans]|uniref:hypothetical protein n=1 Tax=Gibbsiella quercinecans TaxID=929813 RepID=UPI00242E077D|nr:hypothetical protein [Gibbsiella quercinecans]